jgi:hypothetical protein
MYNIAIPSNVLLAPALQRRALYIEARRLHPADSAVYAMTDFRREIPISVWPSRSIEDALSDMYRLGLHALLVTRPRGTRDHELMLGLITLNRIQERRMVERRLPVALRRCDAVSVAEVMIPWDDLAVISYRSLRYFNVAEVWQMLQDAGLSHVVVVETGDAGSVNARGLISWAELKKRLYEAHYNETHCVSAD